IIKPASLVSVFKNSIEEHYLSKIVQVVDEFYIKQDKDLVSAFQIMHSLCRVPRFDLTLMFLGRSDKEVINSIIHALNAASTAGSHGFTTADVEKVGKVWKVAV
ncbi:hypothetical protein HK102_007485, partial [Quaeritorhiza haematococci]